ncbi:MAG: helix-turn-helix transcriptional regulator [Clostridiales bacterium]|nr:helix-turn-helix transcriptional regulator [Clostridiales bacterium]
MLAKNIKLFRLYNGYTQKQVADILNIERSTYAYYESGKSVPDIETIIKLARLYNISIDFLLGNSDYLKQKYEEEQNGKLKDSSANYNRSSEDGDNDKEPSDEGVEEKGALPSSMDELDAYERQLISLFRRLKEKQTILSLLEALAEKGENE